MAAVPRIFEKVHAGVNRQIQEEGGAKASIFAWAFKVGEKARQKRLAGENVGGLLGMQLGLADKLVYSKVRERMGGNLKYFVSGSAALSKDINAWFDIVGMTILEGYGLTETSAATTINRPGNVAVGTVGQPLPGTEIRIADDGEIMVRGGGVMREYRNRPEANVEVFGDQPEGPNRWFATGDIGVIDEAGRVRSPTARRTWSRPPAASTSPRCHRGPVQGALPHCRTGRHHRQRAQLRQRAGGSGPRRRQAVGRRPRQGRPTSPPWRPTPRSSPRSSRVSMR